MKTLITVAVMLFIALAFQPFAHAGELELGATITQGESHTVTGLIGIEHKAGDTALSASYRYGETDGYITTDKGSLSTIYNLDVSDRWSLWLFNKAGFNHVKGIDAEDFIGFGPKFYMVKNPSMTLSMSAGYLHQYTEHETSPSSTTHRMSYRLKFSMKDGDSESSAIFFYQPGIEDPQDYLTMSKAFYKVALNDALALKVVVEDEYRSIDEAPRHETLGYISLVMRF